MTVGLGLVAVGEIVYIEDVFQDTPSYRFNTVFKADYQAWFLLAIAASVAVFAVRRRVPCPAGLAWKAGVVVLVAIAALYPVAASYSRLHGVLRPSDARRRTLADCGRRSRDPLAARTSKARRRSSRTPGPTSPEGHARVSTFTGLPAVIGWVGHESSGTTTLELGRQTSRASTRPSIPAWLGRLSAMGVRYVFVGSLERERYSPAAFASSSAWAGRSSSRGDGRLRAAFALSQRGLRALRRTFTNALAPHARVLVQAVGCVKHRAAAFTGLSASPVFSSPRRRSELRRSAAEGDRARRAACRSRTGGSG